MPSIITLSSLCTFPWQGGESGKKKEKENHSWERRESKEKKRRRNWIMSWHPSQKKKKKKKRDAWLSDVWPIFRRSLSLLLSLISFLPLIYSKRSRLTQIHWRSRENALPQELKHTYRNAHARRLADCTPRQWLERQNRARWAGNDKQFLILCEGGWWEIQCLCAVKRHMCCMCPTVCVMRGLRSNRDSPIINYSLAGITLALISNNKISWHDRLTAAKDVRSLQFWGRNWAALSRDDG